MINWELYKGKDNNRAKQAYIGFCEMLEESNYKLLSEYKNNKIKVKLQCDEGHEYEVRPDNFKSGHRCPMCAGLHSKTAKNDFIEQLEKEGYKLLSEYKGTMKKVKLMCDKNHEYEVIPNSFKRGFRCPKCNISKGEKRVADYLDLNNIKYVAQKKFKKCKYKNMLLFDFYIPNKNIIIEFDGIQHYIPVDFSGKMNTTSLNKRYQEDYLKDSIKNAYCILNNIKLIRIGYYQIDEIENILNGLF